MTFNDYNLNIGLKSPYTQNAWGDSMQSFTPQNNGSWNTSISNAWNGVPYTYPQENNNNWNNWFNSYGWNFSPSTQSSTKDSSDVGESRDEYLAKKEEMLKANESEIKECENQINETNKSINEAEKVAKEINKNKKADGSAEVGKKLSEMSTFGVIGTAISGIVTGICDTVASAVKGILGFDKDGNWSLKKCLIGVGTTALLALACTPAAAVAIPALAYLAPALACAGIAAGVGMAAVGGVKVYKAVKHDSAEEFKDGFAKIGAGTATAVVSYRGFKKCGGFQTAHENYTAIKNIKAGINPILAECGPNATALTATNTTNTGSGWNNYKNCVGQYKDYLNFKKFMPMAKTHQENFNNAINNMESKLKNVQQCIQNTTDPAQLQKLQAQETAYAQELINLQNAKNGDINSWNAVGTSLKDIKPKGWRKYIPYSSDKALNKDINALNKSLDMLQKEKFKLVTLMSKRSHLYGNAVENFGFTSKHGGLWNYVTSARSSYSGMSNGKKFGGLIRLASSFMGWQYTVSPIAKNNPCFYPMVSYAGFMETPKHGFGSLVEMIPGVQSSQAYTKDQVAELNKQIKDAKKMRDDLIKKKDKLSYNC